MLEFTDGQGRMIANPGEAIEAPTVKIGNTMTHVKFAQGPTQMFNVVSPDRAV